MYDPQYITKEELIKYLQENLKINIDWFDTGNIQISLSLEDVTISQTKYDSPNWEYSHSDFDD
jgi:hypothetical protein